MATTELTVDTFQQTVVDNDIVLVDFWADWCGPCKRFGPVFDAASSQHEDIVFGKVDTEAQPALFAATGATSIPLLMGFREGILVFSQPGALPPAGLAQVIDAIKGLDMDDVKAQLASKETSAS